MRSVPSADVVGLSSVRRPLAVLIAAAIATLALSASSAAVSQPKALTPVVLFPAFHFTKLEVTVHNQTAAPGCPRSGSFQDWYQNPHPSNGFSQVCRDELLTLRYDANPERADAQAVLESARRDRVSSSITARPSSAPFYSVLYQTLEKAGYTADKNIRVAGYDARLTPDIGGFLPRTVALIDSTYRANGDQPVQLVGHSNGPLYAQYLLTHTTRAWRHKYIHGFTPIAGNFPGQGSVYSIMFTGLNTENFSLPEDPRRRGRERTHVPQLARQLHELGRPRRVRPQRGGARRNDATGVKYTPADYRRLFTDAHLPDRAPDRQLLHRVRQVQRSGRFPRRRRVRRARLRDQRPSSAPCCPTSTWARW